MPVAVQVISSPPASPTPAPYKPGEFSAQAPYGDFRDQLFKDGEFEREVWGDVGAEADDRSSPFFPCFFFSGWAVVPKAFTEENAKAYASKGHDFLESHKLGE